MLKFSPNGDRVLIRPLKTDELKGAKFSIIMSHDQSKEAAQQGIIVEAGPLAIYPVGTMVIFNPAAGDELRVWENNMFVEMRLLHSDTIHAEFKVE